MEKITKLIICLICSISIVVSLSACNLIKFFDAPTNLNDMLSGTSFPDIKDLVDEENQSIPVDPGEPGDPGGSGVYMDIEEDSMNPVAPGEGASNIISDLTLKPVGFINVGTINATVQPWSYIPLDSQGFKNPPDTSTVSSASGGGGDSPNTSSYLSLPLGTYTWCIDWEEEDKDGDGYFDYYHYFETTSTLLDENDSDDLDFAEIVTVKTPPDLAPIYEGKCGLTGLKESCIGKELHFKTFVEIVTNDPNFQLDATAPANIAFRQPPAGIKVTTSSPESVWDANIILRNGNWIEATTNDPYSAMGVQIFGDKTIGWARVLFDGSPIWEGDTSTSVIDPNENSGLGWYGIYVEAVCVPPGTHTIRVESGPQKEGVGGWQGGVPVLLFGYKW
jgi:hypothetical protein